MMAPSEYLGPYRLVRKLATGGMAEVYLADREGPHGFRKHVALKRILPQSTRDPEFVSMFIEEAKVAARLAHPNLVQVFDFGEERGELYLAMEFVDGTNVNRLLRKIAARKETVPVDLALHVVAQIAHGLAYAHRVTDEGGKPLGFVHRDVSPANVLLTRTGHAKLADFGIAMVASRVYHTDAGQVRGKLGYMSPEQVVGKRLDGKSDVFTLATVLAEMITAEPLFGQGSDLDILLRIRDVQISVLERHRRRIPPDVLELLERALVKDPDRRPSAAVFAEACDEILRRRGLGQANERLARSMERFGLVEGRTEGAYEPGTALVDTTPLVGAREAPNPLGITSPAVYRVRTKSGIVLGPMSLPKVIELFTTGRIDGRSEIEKDGIGFAAANELPELTRFITSRALSWNTKEIENAERTGELSAASLVSVFFEIVNGKRTGVLHLADGSRRKKVYFVDGRPEFVASTDARELLGEYLVARGLCLRMEVEMALALLPRYGGRLGEALVGLGILRPVDLFRAISDQVRDRVLEAFRWRRGQYAFVAEVRSHEETFPLAYDPYELLRDAVVGAHPEELAAALEPVAEVPIVLAAAPPVAISNYRLDDGWNRLLASLRRPTTFSQVLSYESARGGLDAESVHRAVLLGLACRLIEFAPRNPATSPPPLPPRR